MFSLHVILLRRIVQQDYEPEKRRDKPLGFVEECQNGGIRLSH